MKCEAKYFQYRVSAQGEMFEGEKRFSVAEAKRDVAQKAIDKLIVLD